MVYRLFEDGGEQAVTAQAGRNANRLIRETEKGVWEFVSHSASKPVWSTRVEEVTENVPSQVHWGPLRRLGRGGVGSHCRGGVSHV